MKSKSGKAVTAVTPSLPEPTIAADETDPGKVAKIKAKQQQGESGKYGAKKVKPYQPPVQETESSASESSENEPETVKSFIEVELKDEQGAPVAGQKYQIELTDGSVAKGTLDCNGYVKISNIDEGTCKVTFPDLDEQAWS